MDNITFKNFLNKIKNVTPYFYLQSFKNKFDKLIKDSDQFNDDIKKITFNINNINDCHFRLRDKKMDKKINKSGFTIIYTKKNGSTFTNTKNGKFIVFNSINKDIKVNDEILEIDNKNPIYFIKKIINSYKYIGYNPIKSLGDLQKRSLDLLNYMNPKIVKLKRNGKMLHINIDKEYKYNFSYSIKKENYYKDIKINNKKSFYFCVNTFSLYDKKSYDNYYKILKKLEKKLNNYEYLIIDLRNNCGGDRIHSDNLLKIIFNEYVVEYIYSKERLQRIYKKSNELKQNLEQYYEQLLEEDLEQNKEYIITDRDENIKIKKEDLKDIGFKKKIIVLSDFNCGSTCSISLYNFIQIRNILNLNNIKIIGTEDSYDTKFTHPCDIEYKDYTLVLPTMYRKYRERKNYETIKPDYYYLDITMKNKVSNIIQYLQ